MNNFIAPVKNILVASLFLIGVVIPIQSTAATQTYQFTVINKTGYSIYYVHTSSAGTGTWSEDLLGDEVIIDNEIMNLDSPAGCTVDIRFIDEDDDEYYKWNVNICTDSKVTVEILDLYTGTTELADATATFTIQNNTGQSIWYVYASEPEANSYTDDLLGDEVIIDGTTVPVVRPGGLCTFDLHIKDSNGSSYRKWGVNVCAGTTVFTQNDLQAGSVKRVSSPNSSSSAQATYVTIQNDTGYEVYFLYVSPSASTEWGIDRLGDETLPSGDEFVVSLSDGTCYYDLRLEDEDSDTYTRLEVDVCSYPIQSFGISDLDVEE